MSLSPDEVRRHGLEARRGRYAKPAVDRLLEEIFASYEELWRERDELSARAQGLQQELASFRELESALRDSIVTGQRAAGEVVQEARRERERIIETARIEAEDIIRSARAEKERLTHEVERLRTLDSELEANYRAFLLAALNVLEDRPPQPPVLPLEERPAHPAVHEDGSTGPLPKASLEPTRGMPSGQSRTIRSLPGASTL
jgi:cell division initiation protein